MNKLLFFCFLASTRILTISNYFANRYVHTPLAPKTKASDFAASNMPMVAMFLRNKAIAWSAFFIAFQSYMNEPLISDPADQSQPPIMKIIFATVSVLVSYLDIVFPTMGHPPPSKASSTAATVASSVTTAITSATN